MKITILVSDKEHPINPYLEKWVKTVDSDHAVDIIRNKNELTDGDLLFLISCHDLITQKERNKYTKCLVVHASDLPLGRGWSPHVWSIINGEKEIIVSLLEAEDQIDSGRIWKKLRVYVPRTALFKQISQLLFDAELELMNFAIQSFNNLSPIDQDDLIEPAYWPKRSPIDSQLDVDKSISEQFNLIRICDPERYPAFFYIDGKKFTLTIEAADEE